MTTNIQIPSPLGFCAKHLANGRRVPATTLFEGTSACDVCAVDSYAGNSVDALHKLGVADREAAAAAASQVW